MAKPVIYLIFTENRGQKSTRFGGFLKRLAGQDNLPDADFRVLALKDLQFVITDKGHFRIYNFDNTEVLSDASYVYFKSWESLPDEASTVALYLDSLGIPYDDPIVGRDGINKLWQLAKLTINAVNVLPMVAGHKPTPKLITKFLGSGKYIVKPSNGSKGNDVELHNSSKSATAHRLSGQKCLIVQDYVENEGDFRIFVYGNKVRGGIFRRASPVAYLNNTSKGAESRHIKVKDLRPEVMSIARHAAKLAGNTIAGVDVIINKNSRAFVLEVNQGSQIVTGHHTDKKIRAFNEFLSETLESIKTDKTTSGVQEIGRKIFVSLPDLGLTSLVAKIDTGAYRSSIHAENIRVVEDVLNFEIIDGDKRIKIQSAEFSSTIVTNASRKPEMRYKIITTIVIAGKTIPTEITLTDRSAMKYPVLLGRKLLRNNFLVNVELSEAQ